MGSEAPSRVTIHVTGFKKFQGVTHNPTETIASNLKTYVEKRGLRPGVTLGSSTVLEAAGYGALPMFYQVMESGLAGENNSNNEQVVWLHLGVNNALHKFAIEQQAVNEATFLCPDELGWQPQQLPIVFADGEISQTRETRCSVEAILQFLKQEDHAVTISKDAGRYICNYIYYLSLQFAEQKGHKSLFVHVPLFSKIKEETQMEFVAALLEAIAATC